MKFSWFWECVTLSIEYAARKTSRLKEKLSPVIAKGTLHAVTCSILCNPVQYSASSRDSQVGEPPTSLQSPSCRKSCSESSILNSLGAELQLVAERRMDYVLKILEIKCGLYSQLGVSSEWHNESPWRMITIIKDGEEDTKNFNWGRKCWHIPSTTCYHKFSIL